MIKQEDMDDKMLAYQIMEVKYIKAMGREVSWDINKNRDLYPADWFSNDDYVKKANILAEAIEKKCLISETVAYLHIIEGVREEKEENEEER